MGSAATSSRALTLILTLTLTLALTIALTPTSNPNPNPSPGRLYLNFADANERQGQPLQQASPTAPY